MKPSKDLEREHDTENQNDTVKGILLANDHASSSSESAPLLGRKTNDNTISDPLFLFKYITFVMIGIALLWPWNSFLSASPYFFTRFSHHQWIQSNYTSFMMTISTITSTTYNFYLANKQVGVRYERRVMNGLWIAVFVFMILGLSCVVWTDVNETAYFVLVMTCVWLSAIGTCQAQNGIMACCNVMGGIYAQGFMVGQAIAGVLPSIVLIFSKLFVQTKNGKREDENDSTQPSLVEINVKSTNDPGTMVYFLTATVISFISVSLFLVLLQKCGNELTIKESSLESEQQPQPNEHGPQNVEEEHIPFKVLWRKLQFIVSTIFLVFCITLAFPVFASHITSTHKNSSSKFKRNDIFISIAYLLWNTGDLIGRLSCAIKKLVVRDRLSMVLYSLLRFTFIPLLFLCNIHDQKTAILGDFTYMSIMFWYGVSNGHLCSSAFMSVGQYVSDKEKKAAGGFTTIFLSLGLMCGSIFSFGVGALININQ